MLYRKIIVYRIACKSLEENILHLKNPNSFADWRRIQSVKRIVYRFACKWFRVLQWRCFFLLPILFLNQKKEKNPLLQNLNHLQIEEGFNLWRELYDLGFCSGGFFFPSSNFFSQVEEGKNPPLQNPISFADWRRIQSVDLDHYLSSPISLTPGCRS